jgi:anti-sigma factor RsiW
MNSPGCERFAFADLVDYAAGELPDTEAAALEEHLFSCSDCGARAAEVDALVRAIGPAVRSGEVGGFVTDEVLNRLSRDGIRVRTFAFSPGAVVPCAVWDDDELIAMRLRADFGGASEFTLSQRIAGAEVVRATGQVAPSSHGELIYAVPASWIRPLAAVELEVVLSVREGDEERSIGTYTLVHGGFFHRS